MEKKMKETPYPFHSEKENEKIQMAPFFTF